MIDLITRLREAATNTNLTNEAANRIEELESSTVKASHFNHVCNIYEYRITKLKAQLDAVLNAEIDWHDGSLMVKDLGAVQAALNGEDDE